MTDALTHPELVAACAKHAGEIRASLLLMTVALDHYAHMSAVEAVEAIQTAAASLWDLVTDNGANPPERDP